MLSNFYFLGDIMWVRYEISIVVRFWVLGWYVIIIDIDSESIFIIFYEMW